MGGKKNDSVLNHGQQDSQRLNSLRALRAPSWLITGSLHLISLMKLIDDHRPAKTNRSDFNSIRFELNWIELKLLRFVLAGRWTHGVKMHIENEGRNKCIHQHRVLRESEVLGSKMLFKYPSSQRFCWAPQSYFIWLHSHLNNRNVKLQYLTCS